MGFIEKNNAQRIKQETLSERLLCFHIEGNSLLNQNMALAQASFEQV
jgi:hypothetical protein